MTLDKKQAGALVPEQSASEAEKKTKRPRRKKRAPDAAAQPAEG